MLQTTLAARVSRAFGLDGHPAPLQQAPGSQPALSEAGEELRRGLLLGREGAADGGQWQGLGGEPEALSDDGGVCGGGVCPA